MFDRAVQAVKANHADVDPGDLQAAIDEAVPAPVLSAAVWSRISAIAEEVGLIWTGNPLMVSSVAVILSQIISNVPLVMLYLPILKAQMAKPAVYLALAGASTLAGNLTIMGAASNVIMLESARKRDVNIGWFEFLKYGILMTIIPLAFMLAWMKLLNAF